MMSAPVADQQAFFDRAAATWDETMTDEVRSRLAEIVAGLGIAAGAMILDVGCGTGILFPLLAAAVGERGRVVGLDVSHEMLRRAAAKVGADGHPPLLVQADAHRPPLRHAAFDWVICNAVLPHFGDKQAALTALTRCLAQGGRLVVCHAHSRQFINNLHRDAGGPVAEDRVPDPELMARLLRDAGLEPLSILDGADRYVALARKPSTDQFPSFPVYQSTSLPIHQHPDQETTMLDITGAQRFHGHMCPGLAIGIRAAEIALAEIGAHSADEEIVAIVETDMCGVDAIQYLTGCTFGKGNLIHLDYGKNAFTFIRRGDGKAIRIVARPDAFGPPDPGWPALRARVFAGEATLEEQAQFHAAQAQRTQAILDAPLDRLFDVQPVEPRIPARARIMASLTCEACGEAVMETRTRRFGGRTLCIPCFEAAEKRW